jgi:hypothetical protein
VLNVVVAPDGVQAQVETRDANADGYEEGRQKPEVTDLIREGGERALGGPWRLVGHASPLPRRQGGGHGTQGLGSASMLASTEKYPMSTRQPVFGVALSSMTNAPTRTWRSPPAAKCVVVEEQ